MSSHQRIGRMFISWWKNQLDQLFITECMENGWSELWMEFWGTKILFLWKWVAINLLAEWLLSWGGATQCNASNSPVCLGTKEWETKPTVQSFMSEKTLLYMVVPFLDHWVCEEVCLIAICCIIDHHLFVCIYSIHYQVFLSVQFHRLISYPES